MSDSPSSWAPQLHPEVAWVIVGDEVVALDPEGNHVHLLSSSGALLFQLFDGQTSTSELAADVAEVFGIPLEAALDDVSRFARQMVDKGLVLDPFETPLIGDGGRDV